jgi:hypothetical protein
MQSAGASVLSQPSLHSVTRITGNRGSGSQRRIGGWGCVILLCGAAGEALQTQHFVSAALVPGTLCKPVLVRWPIRAAPFAACMGGASRGLGLVDTTLTLGTLRHSVAAGGRDFSPDRSTRNEIGLQPRAAEPELMQRLPRLHTPDGGNGAYRSPTALHLRSKCRKDWAGHFDAERKVIETCPCVRYEPESFATTTYLAIYGGPTAYSMRGFLRCFRY